MTGWKHSFERLSKHKYVTCIVHPKKVVCICGKIIKINRKWEVDRHVRRSGCKANEGQRTIYNWFQPVELNKELKQAEQVEEEEYNSDVYDKVRGISLLIFSNYLMSGANFAYQS